MKKMLVCVAMFVAAFAVTSDVQAQFGYYDKNKAYQENMDKFYQSAHFNFYHGLDLTNPALNAAFTDVVAELERGYDDLSLVFDHQLKTKPNVVVYRTHSTFESSFIVDYEFMPEGVGAYAEPSRNRLVVKPDFLQPLNRTIYLHELTHIFQFDIVQLGFLARTMQSEPLPLWFVEGMADYFANRFKPYTRDDIRSMEQRGAAANPEKDLPTIYALNSGQGNEYSMGAMVFTFIEKTYGPDAVRDFCRDGLKGKQRIGMMARLADMSNGAIDSPETFDRMHRDFWRNHFQEKWGAKPKPYDDTENFTGRFVMTQKFPFPIVSPALSADGKEVAFFTFHRKYGLVLAKTLTAPRDFPPYVKMADRKKKRGGGPFRGFGEPSPESYVTILTPYMPPKHYETLTAQLLATWPFNGYDLDWWQDPEWVSRLKEANARLADVNKEIAGTRVGKTSAAKFQEKTQLEKAVADIRREKGKSKLAFFARKDRDHALFIVDSNDGDILKTVAVPFDQAVTPAFSPDGQTVYFSAAKNIERDIYALNLETEEYERLTNGDSFNSAPAVSPDGTKLAYIAFVGDFQKLFVLDLVTGTKTQLTFNRTNENSPSWSQDRLTIRYTSDEPRGDTDRIWNLYSLDLATRVVSQWTDFYGGVFTPRSVPGEPDRVYYVGYWQYDQFRDYIYSNFELLDIRLKKPYRQFVSEDRSEFMQYSFRSGDLDKHLLDAGQLENPFKPPRKWKFYGENAVFGGYSTYWGAFGYTQLGVSDILNQRVHSGIYMKQGYWEMMDYSYMDRSRRWAWLVNAHRERLPLYYQTYGVSDGYPKQPCADNKCDNQFSFNDLIFDEWGSQFALQYPFNKWTRVEFGLNPRLRKYPSMNGLDKETFDLAREAYPDFFSPLDVDVFNYFNGSSAKSVGLSAAWVRDTVLYSYDTMVPLHGNAVRVQAQFAPSVGNLTGYVSALADARMYRRLSAASVFALRFAGMTSTRPNGDFIFLGGSDTLRAYPYASVVGNNVAYGSAELRFPLVDAVVISGLGAVGPIRGLLFADYGLAKFTGGQMLVQKAWSVGGGLNMAPFNVVWAYRSLDPKPRHLRFDFYLGYNF